MINIAFSTLKELKIKPWNYIYVVWHDHISDKPECLYVGKTIRGVKQRMVEHVIQDDNLGCYLKSVRDLSMISISIYRPEECMIAIEKEFGLGFNPEYISLKTAEECMIKLLNPKLNIIGVESKGLDSPKRPCYNVS